MFRPGQLLTSAAPASRSQSESLPPAHVFLRAHAGSPIRLAGFFQAPASVPPRIFLFFIAGGHCALALVSRSDSLFISVPRKLHIFHPFISFIYAIHINSHFTHISQKVSVRSCVLPSVGE